MRPAKVERPLPETIIVPSDNRILYYRRDRTLYRFLSHFYPSSIEIDGERWMTVEHYYQAQKSHDELYKDAIRSAKSAEYAKQLAADPGMPRNISKRSWFLQHACEPRPDWNDVKLDVMRRGDLAKFSQHEVLLKLLLATGDAELVEDSESEPFWGLGSDGQGFNWAGRILMEVRSVLASKG